MSDRPDLDEAIRIAQAGGLKITGGKYAPNTTGSNEREELERICFAMVQRGARMRDHKTFGVEDEVNEIMSLLQKAEQRGRIDELRNVLTETETGDASIWVRKWAKKRIAELNSKQGTGDE